MSRPIPHLVATKATAGGTFLKPKRRGVPADIAQRVFERDGGKCVGCGESRLSSLTLDHIVPVALGGDNLIGNLQSLCQNCNSNKKHHLTPAAMRRLHPEISAADLEYISEWAPRPRMKVDGGIRWADTIHPVRIVRDMRSVLVPVEHHSAVMEFVASLRERTASKNGTDG